MGADTDHPEADLRSQNRALHREIERLIDEGKVRINGQLAKIGDHVQAGDKVNIGNRKAVIKSEVNRIRVLIYNKPEGEIVARSDPEGRSTVFEALPKLKAARWVAVGRLDVATTGLLLFTTDGALANALMHPSANIEREYMVRVNGEVTQDTLKILHEGVMQLRGTANVQVDDVDPLRAELLPTPRLIHGRIVVDLDGIEPALPEPHGLVVEDIDRRVDDHVAQGR